MCGRISLDKALFFALKNLLNPIPLDTLRNWILKLQFHDKTYRSLKIALNYSKLSFGTTQYTSFYTHRKSRPLSS